MILYLLVTAFQTYCVVELIRRGRNSTSAGVRPDFRAGEKLARSLFLNDRGEPVYDRAMRELAALRTSSVRNVTVRGKNGAGEIEGSKNQHAGVRRD